MEPSTAPVQSTEQELNNLHAMLVPLDVGAADAVWTALYSLHTRLDTAHQERSAIAQVAEQLRVRQS